MKFLVKSIGTVVSVTRGKAFWNTWKPQNFLSCEDVDANSDSGYEG